MRLVSFRVIRSAGARTLGDLARIPFRTISPQLRNLCAQWDAEYCLQLMLARFGSPSYREPLAGDGQAWVWVLWCKKPENTIYVEFWPSQLPQGFYLHCRYWNAAVVDFCLWLTRGHLQRHLLPVQGGKA